LSRATPLRPTGDSSVRGTIEGPACSVIGPVEETICAP